MNEQFKKDLLRALNDPVFLAERVKSHYEDSQVFVKYYVVSSLLISDWLTYEELSEVLGMNPKSIQMLVKEVSSLDCFIRKEKPIETNKIGRKTKSYRLFIL